MATNAATIDHLLDILSGAGALSALWTGGDQSAGPPTVGQMLQNASNGVIDGVAYDTERATRAHLGMW